MHTSKALFKTRLLFIQQTLDFTSIVAKRFEHATTIFWANLTSKERQTFVRVSFSLQCVHLSFFVDHHLHFQFLTALNAHKSWRCSANFFRGWATSSTEKEKNGCKRYWWGRSESWQLFWIDAGRRSFQAVVSGAQLKRATFVKSLCYLRNFTFLWCQKRYLREAHVPPEGYWWRRYTTPSSWVPAEMTDVYILNTFWLVVQKLKKVSEHITKLGGFESLLWRLGLERKDNVFSIPYIILRFNMESSIVVNSLH